MPDKASEHSCWIVDDLDTITHIAENEVDPKAAGLSRSAINKVWARVEDLYRTGAYPGIQFCLRRRGEVVLNRAIGHARGNGPQEPLHVPKTPLSVDTPVCLFSASKAVTAALMHKAAELGLVDLDAPVARYIEEFAQKGKGNITIADVLSHRSGISVFDLPLEDISPDLLFDWDFIIKTLCETPMPENFGKQAYHAVTGGYIFAEILKRVTGESIQVFMDKYFRQPMGMKYFEFGLAKEHRNDAAINYIAGTPVIYPISQFMHEALGVPFEDVVEISNLGRFMDAIVPAANIYSNAEELSCFYEMMLNNGQYNGQQIMAPETVARAIKPVSGIQFDQNLKIPMKYSEGFMVGANPAGVYGPMTADAWGHIGFMHIFGWASPRHELSASLFTTGKSVVGPHVVPIGTLLSSIAWHCRPR